MKNSLLILTKIKLKTEKKNNKNKIKLNNINKKNIESNVKFI